jgi:hypothetical protein
MRRKSLFACVRVMELCTYYESKPRTDQLHFLRFPLAAALVRLFGLLNDHTIP